MKRVLSHALRQAAGPRRVAPLLARGLSSSAMASARAAAASSPLQQPRVGRWAAPASRSFSDLGNASVVTADTASHVQRTILLLLENGQPGKGLDQILVEAERPLSERWEQMISIFLTTQVHAIMPFGFTSDEPGLTAYTQSLQRLLTNDVVVQAEVRDLGKQIWEVMLRRAFAVEHGEPLELTTAREIVTKVSFLMQSPAFLDRVKTEVAVAVDALSSSATEHELFDAKRKVLSRMLPEAFMEVIVDFDYIGESGYVQMQAALFDHMMDQTISHLMAAASQQVMTAAGVTDMPAPPQQ